MIQRFFQPVNTILFQLARYRQGMLHLPRTARIARHAPCLVGINHDLHCVSDRLTNSGHYLEITPEVIMAHTNLHCTKPLFPKAENFLYPLRWGMEFAG